MSTRKAALKSLAVIDPAVRKPELEAFNRLAACSPIPLSYHLPALHGLDSLERLHGDLAGVLILGSLSSVNDGHAWQQAMNEWLIAEWKKGTPTLGICYGHQLIAHLHGAKVGLISADGHKLAGLRKIRLQPNALWGGRAQEGEVAVSHQEEVKACPTGFEIVATSREIGIEALAHQTLPIWSFQSHPEATISFLRNRGIADPSNGSWTRFGHSLVQHFLNFVAAGSKKNGDRKDRSPSRTPFSRKSPSRRGKASSRPRGRRSKVRARS